MDNYIQTKYTFDSLAERDFFLNSHFPRRKCSECPGLFDLPNGGAVSVFMFEVTTYTRKENVA